MSALRCSMTLIGLLCGLFPQGHCQQAEMDPPSRVVLVVWGQESSPIAKALDQPLSSLQKLASEHGYRIYQRDRITFIVPDHPRFYELTALNQFLEPIPPSLLQNGKFLLDELPEESQSAFRIYFSNLLSRIDYEAPIRIGVNIFAKLPSSPSSMERELKLVATVEGGVVRSVDWASAVSIYAGSREGRSSTDAPQQHLGLSRNTSLSLHFNFNPPPDRIAEILREIASLLDEQQEQTDRTRRKLIRQVAEACLADIILPNGITEMHRLPSFIARSIESYCQAQGISFQSLGFSTELIAEVYLSIPLMLSSGRTYISISLGQHSTK